MVLILKIRLLNPRLGEFYKKKKKKRIKKNEKKKKNSGL